MEDLIRRSDAVKVVKKYRGLSRTTMAMLADDIRAIPSADRPSGYIHINDVYRLIAGHSDYHGDSILSAFTCLTEGKEVKPIKPLGRPQGEWIYCEDYVGHDGYECSNCGFFIPWAYDCYADSNFILNYHTCPRCDARMKGADDESVDSN